MTAPRKPPVVVKPSPTPGNLVRETREAIIDIINSCGDTTVVVAALHALTTITTAHHEKT